MKKRTLFRSGAAFLMGLLMTAAVGCFTSFAYDSAWLKACSVENGNSISVTGTATTGALNEGELRMMDIIICSSFTHMSLR